MNKKIVEEIMEWGILLLLLNMIFTGSGITGMATVDNNSVNFTNLINEKEDMSNIMGFIPETKISETNVRIIPTDDAYCGSIFYGDTNHDGEPLTVDNDEWDSTSFHRQSFLKFNISDYNSSNIINATLNLVVNVRNVYCDSQYNKVALYKVNDDSWLESTLLWANKPNLGTKIDNKDLALVLVTMSYNVTNYTIEVLNGDKIISFGLWRDQNSNCSCSFYSKENITYSPELILVTSENEQDIVDPTIHLINPINATVTSTALQTFNCNITDDTSIANLTLYLWNSTEDNIHTNTTNLLGVSNSTTFAYTLPYEDTFEWNCLGYDSAENNNWSEEDNYSIVFDTTAPTISINSPENITYNNVTVLVNITSNGNNIWFFNGTENETYTNPVYRIFSEGSNTLLAYANDTVGNLNTTNVNFTIDTTTPIISIQNPNSGVTLSYTTTRVELTISTNEFANCEYGFSVFNFTNGANFTWSNGTLHKVNRTVLQGNTYFQFYVCRDLGENEINTLHGFTIDNEPQSTGGGGGGGNDEPPEIEICSASWDCSDWETCLPGGTQIRSCSCLCPDNNDCTGDNSESKSCTYIPTCSDGIRNQDETDVDCGGICDGCNIGKDCTWSMDCTSGLCMNGKCVESGCNNDIKDYGESDVDCGGNCNECNVGKSCSINDDCLTNLCINNICLEESCSDYLLNQDESDMDCGGLCIGCGFGKSCSISTDCASNYCLNNICNTASCTDNNKNQDETFIDCGGVICSKCQTGKGCSINDDCITNNCVNNICTQESCTDNIINQDESDVDCGGSCNKCSDNDKCNSNIDCSNNFCLFGKCITPSCIDILQNQDETDVDCGGICGKCDEGKSCNINNDCLNDNCISNTCSAASCADNFKNNQESDVDCGGLCNKCALDKICNIDTDCNSKNCVNNVCKIASCRDDSLNQGETDVDCGGSCISCSLNKNCNINSDCNSNFCSNGKCLEASCNDLVFNGDETSTDCGGSCYACKVGEKCNINYDCLSLFCKDNTCRQASCSDTILNQEETDTDCGGPCQACGAGRTCSLDIDCLSNYCVANLCVMSSCTDNVKNGNELGIDCGGNCLPCASCKDKIKNGDELDVDCGGSCPACFLECKDGTKVEKCSIEKPKYCGFNLNLINDCSSCGCPNNGDICVNGMCTGIGTCTDNIKNQGETGADCGGSCQPCLATCNDGLKNQGEKKTDCGGPCNKCKKEARTEVPSNTGIKIIFLNIPEFESRNFSVKGKEHQLTINKIGYKINMTVASTPFNFGLSINEIININLDDDDIFDIRVKLRRIVSDIVMLEIQIINEKETSVFDIFKQRLESSIDIKSVNVENMPCIKDKKSYQNNFKIFSSDLNFNIPLGYDILIDKFELKCEQSGKLSLSLPNNYEDIQAYACNGECKTVNLEEINSLSCGEEFKEFSTQSKYLKRLGQEKFIETVFSGSRIRKDEFELQFNQQASITYGEPKNIVREPKNSLLKILGNPIAISSDVNLSEEIIISVDEIKEDIIESNSNKLYIKTSKDSWLPLETITQDKLVAKLKNPYKYLDRNKEIVIAQIGKICANCKFSTLKKNYEPDYYVRDALLLVHGFGSSPKTFENILKDIRLTNQPWQVWTFGYPTEKAVSENAVELANHLEANANEFDYAYIVAHSMGGLVTRDALYYSYAVNLEKPGTYTYLNKIKKVILVGVPNKGTPGAETLISLSQFLTNINSGTAIVDVNSPGMQDLINGKNTPIVPNIKYYSIAGTKTFQFGKELIKLEMFGDKEINDGIVSIESAQSINDVILNNRCENFWDIEETHTEILDNPLSRRLIEKIVAEEINKDIENKAILGNIKYYDMDVKCNKEYIIIGKKVNPDKVYDATGCLCGNGFCGNGETEINCPKDCATFLRKENVCTSAPFGILLLLVFILILAAPYIYEKYIKRVKFIRMSKKIKFVSLVGIVFSVINFILFWYYKCNCINYFELSIKSTVLYSSILAGILLLIYEWYIHLFKREEKEIEQEWKTFRIVAKIIKLHVNLLLWLIWISIVIAIAFGLGIVFNLSEELWANWMLNILIVLIMFVSINIINWLLYRKIKIKESKPRKKEKAKKIRNKKVIRKVITGLKKSVIRKKEKIHDIFLFEKQQIKRGFIMVFRLLGFFKTKKEIFEEKKKKYKKNRKKRSREKKKEEEKKEINKIKIKNKSTQIKRWNVFKQNFYNDINYIKSIPKRLGREIGLFKTRKELLYIERKRANKKAKKTRLRNLRIKEELRIENEKKRIGILLKEKINLKLRTKKAKKTRLKNLRIKEELRIENEEKRVNLLLKNKKDLELRINKAKKTRKKNKLKKEKEERIRKNKIRIRKNINIFKKNVNLSITSLRNVPRRIGKKMGLIKTKEKLEKEEKISSLKKAKKIRGKNKLKKEKKERIRKNKIRIRKNINIFKKKINFGVTSLRNVPRKIGKKMGLIKTKGQLEKEEKLRSFRKAKKIRLANLEYTQRQKEEKDIRETELKRVAKIKRYTKKEKKEKELNAKKRRIDKKRKQSQIKKKYLLYKENLKNIINNSLHNLFFHKHTQKEIECLSHKYYEKKIEREEKKSLKKLRKITLKKQEEQENKMLIEKLKKYNEIVIIPKKKQLELLKEQINDHNRKLKGNKQHITKKTAQPKIKRKLFSVFKNKNFIKREEDRIKNIELEEYNKKIRQNKEYLKNKTKKEKIERKYQKYKKAEKISRIKKKTEEIKLLDKEIEKYNNKIEENKKYINKKSDNSKIKMIINKIFKWKYKREESDKIKEIDEEIKNYEKKLKKLKK